MPFVRLSGTFHVKGFEPDGDSIRFRPDDPADWDLIRSARRPRPNSRGMAQLRLEAVDAPETHFAAGRPLGTVRQPEPAFAARDRLLALLGIGGLQLSEDLALAIAAEDGVRGHILTRDVDIHGRPIAFAYAGAAETDRRVFVEADDLAQSANMQLLAAGMVYPTFYTGLFHDLRARLAEASASAASAYLGVWAADATRGCRIDSLASITEAQVILPKLFRRLTTWFAVNGGQITLDGFLSWLEADGERVLVLPNGQITGFDDIVTVEGDTVALNWDPAEIAFVPKD